MCPITKASDLSSLLFLFFMLSWIIVIPLTILLKLDKVLKILEKKDRN